MNSRDTPNLDSQPETIAVIIPCYNQADYLAEAIESALKQTLKPTEIVVIDDGSTDHTALVAGRYTEVSYYYQTNQGLPAARNAGITRSVSDRLVFLDADDRLMPEALAGGAQCLRAYPESAFVYGRYRVMTTDGTLLPPRYQPIIMQDHYLRLLEVNFIAMHATVMYQRWVFAKVGTFDINLKACEDYDLYLRITFEHPIASHDTLVAEYRRQSLGMSRDARFMLHWVLTVLKSQSQRAQEHLRLEKAYDSGMQYWQRLYTKRALRDIVEYLKRGLIKNAGAALAFFIHNWSQRGWRAGSRLPAGITRLGGAIKRRLTLRYSGIIDWGDLRRSDIHAGATPRACRYSLSIEGYYSARFLQSQATAIKGATLLITHHDDLRSFSHPQVDQLEVIKGYPDDNLFIAMLARRPTAVYDTIVMLQALGYQSNPKLLLQTVHGLLKPGGNLFTTFPGCISGFDQENLFWSFTEHSARKCLAEIFSPSQCWVNFHGNVLAAVAHLHGVDAASFLPMELDFRDRQYQVMITGRARKMETDS